MPQTRPAARGSTENRPAGSRDAYIEETQPCPANQHREAVMSSVVTRRMPAPPLRKGGQGGSRGTAPGTRAPPDSSLKRTANFQHRTLNVESLRQSLKIAAA